jgi:hypothetical protein
VDIKSYNPMLVPGLLQIRGYAETVIRNAEPTDTPDATIKRYVDLRMERQQILDRARAPKVGAVLDEMALRRAVGGAEVMRAQLHRLVEFAKHAPLGTVR